MIGTCRAILGLALGRDACKKSKRLPVLWFFLVQSSFNGVYELDRCLQFYRLKKVHENFDWAKRLIVNCWRVALLYMELDLGH